jgi:hypothetical protein
LWAMVVSPFDVDRRMKRRRSASGSARRAGRVRFPSNRDLLGIDLTGSAAKGPLQVSVETG